MISSLKLIFNRDLESLQKEIEAYNPESHLWRVEGQIKNSAGNLALHLCGNLQHYIGTILGETGYQRDRPAEFSLKDVPIETLVEQIQTTQKVISSTLAKYNDQDLDQPYPKPFKPDAPGTIRYYLLHLTTHLGYHLGQVNYHRRLIG
ncbi:MAG: DinB family protein [Cyclobacteriaceae bacterium]